MKRFVIEVAACVLITLLLVVLANTIYINCNLAENEMDVFDTMPDTIQVCNVGSSHGKRSFNYSDYSDRLGCFNFGLTSQRFQYDYRLLYHYSDRIEKGAVVFIPISYFSLWGGADEERDDFESMNKRYYRVLPPELIIQYDWWTDICEHYLPVISAYDGVVDALKDTILGDGDNESFVDRQIDLAQSVEDTYRSQVLNLQDEDGNRIVNEERYEALYDVIDLCKDKGFHPVLVTTPLTRMLTDTIKDRNPMFLDDFNTDVMKIADEKGIAYYDYSQDDRICDNTDNFLDSHHLNAEGARLFTDIIMQEIVCNYYDL